MGKTEVAKALAAATGATLIRLQCHEGIDVHHALYDWDYARQLLALRAAEEGIDEGDLEDTLGAALKVHEDVERVRERKVLEGV